MFPATSTTPLAAGLLAPAPRKTTEVPLNSSALRSARPRTAASPNWPFTPMSSDSPASPSNTKPLRPGSRRCTGRLPGLAGRLA